MAMVEQSRLIFESITPLFDSPPIKEKMPGCPQGFVWRGETFHIEALVAEWHDYRRRGKMARNMRPEHAQIAEQRGSWGVGIDYFRVRTNYGRVFDILFDRSPGSASDRKGQWMVEREWLQGDGD